MYHITTRGICCGADVPTFSLMLFYLQKLKVVSSDAQIVKDAENILPIPDFRGALIAPIRHQALALFNPAIIVDKNKILSTYLASNKQT